MYSKLKSDFRFLLNFTLDFWFFFSHYEVDIFSIITVTWLLRVLIRCINEKTTVVRGTYAHQWLFSTLTSHTHTTRLGLRPTVPVGDAKCSAPPIELNAFYSYKVSLTINKKITYFNQLKFEILMWAICVLVEHNFLKS